MRFKEVENSPFHKKTHELEVSRLKNRLEEIKKTKRSNKSPTKKTDKENFLPVIKKNASVGVIKKRQIEYENMRLFRKVTETKAHKSKYLNEVIGINTERLNKTSKQNQKRVNKSKKLEPIQNSICLPKENETTPVSD